MQEAWAICRIFKKPNSNAQRALSQSWISPFSDNHITSNRTNTPLPLSFCGDSSSMPSTFSLLNYQWPPSAGTLQPNVAHANHQEAPRACINDASSLLLDMSTSVLGECLDFHTLPAAEMVQGNGGEVDGDWGLIRFPNYSNLVWDYSSPCPSELSTAYSTNNCYT